jgi:hypothetical protein
MFFRTLSVAVVAMCPLLASQTALNPGQPAPRPGQPAPDFTLPDSTWLAYQIIRLQRESSSARLLGHSVTKAAKL